MANRLDPGKAPQPEEAAQAKPEQAAPRKSGGSWLPLLLNIILMPAIAYGMTVFVLIPKIEGGRAASESADG